MNGSGDCTAIAVDREAEIKGSTHGRLISDVDTTLNAQILDIDKRKLESHKLSGRTANDFGRIAVALEQYRRRPATILTAAAAGGGVGVRTG